MEGTATFVVTYTVRTTITISGESFHSNPGEDLFDESRLKGNVEAVHSVELVSWEPKKRSKR